MSKLETIINESFEYAKEIGYTKLITLALAGFVAGGCQNYAAKIGFGCPTTDVAKARLGSYASAAIGTKFLDLEDLGKHGSISEGNGQYTVAK